MWATSDGPRIEDFGIDEHDLARAPELLVSSHRIPIVAFAYGVVGVALFWVIFRTGGSAPAAVVFALIALAAGSVLLLPAVLLIVCAGERAEERWLCRRVPTLRACLAYRRAVADHARHAGRAVRSRTVEDWSLLSHAALVETIRSRIGDVPEASVTPLDREATGGDLLAELPGRRVLIRCEAGAEPVAAAVARELVAALDDLEADAAVILAPGGTTRQLADYLAGRPIVIVHPEATEGLLETPPPQPPG